MTVNFDILSIIGLVIILAYLGSRGLGQFGVPQVVESWEFCNPDHI
jgi:hypothetical protein